jgi:two-component system, OmpR family, response regulator RpaA
MARAYQIVSSLNYPLSDRRSVAVLKPGRGFPENLGMARILVIDDDGGITHLLRLVLEGDGHEVLVANDGSRGFALAQRQRPDLVILDVMMRVMSGVAVLRALANDPRTGTVPVVMVSALAREDVGGMPDDVHVAAYIRKPFSAVDLLATVSELVRATTDVAS